MYSSRALSILTQFCVRQDITVGTAALNSWEWWVSTVAVYHRESVASECHHKLKVWQGRGESRFVTGSQRARVVKVAEQHARIGSAAATVARAASSPLKTAYGHARQQRAKKKQKKIDDDEIRTHAILEGFTPVAEKMDCYVSHFLTGIIAGKNWPPRSGRQCPKNVKVRLTTRE